jgi:hypothetical protein
MRKAVLLSLFTLVAALTLGLVDTSPGRAAFPGANGKIAFQSDRDGATYEIYKMNADGSGQTRLTNNTANLPTGIVSSSPPIASVPGSAGADDLRCAPLRCVE